MPEIAASPYYKTWTAQAPLERMLRAHVMGLSQVHMRVGWRLDGFMERESAVAATLVECASGRTESIKTNFLVGCDGANSAVRAILKIPLEGRGTLGQAAGIYFRAPELAAKLMGGGDNSVSAGSRVMPLTTVKPRSTGWPAIPPAIFPRPRAKRLRRDRARRSLLPPRSHLARFPRAISTRRAEPPPRPHPTRPSWRSPRPEWPWSRC